MIPKPKLISFGKHNYTDLWDTWSFTREQKNRLLAEIKARLSIFVVYEYLGGQLYRGAQDQSTYCCLHSDKKRSAKVTDEYYKCYAGCDGGDVIWLLHEAWEIGYGELIQRAEKVFKLGLRDDLEVANRVIYGGSKEAAKKPEDTGQGEVVDRMKVNRVYKALLSELPFTEFHSNKFQKERNLPEELVKGLADNGYCSYDSTWELALVGKLRNRLGNEGFSGVPGFYMDSNIWRFNAPSGVILPVKDMSGLVTALLVRSDQDIDKKYSYVSSVDRNRGTKANYGFHVIRKGNSFKKIWIIEGILKSDVVSYYMDGLIFGLPSLSGGRSGLMEIIRQFEGSSVHICMDADWRSKPAVKKGVTGLAKAVCKGLDGKHDVFMVNWDPKDGKGMDDVLSNVGKKALKIKKIMSTDQA